MSGAARTYRSRWRQEGHNATATPTPMETIRSKVNASPMNKRRIVALWLMSE